MVTTHHGTYDAGFGLHCARILSAVRDVTTSLCKMPRILAVMPPLPYWFHLTVVRSTCIVSIDLWKAYGSITTTPRLTISNNGQLTRSLRMRNVHSS